MAGYVLVVFLLMGSAGYGAWHLMQTTQDAKASLAAAQNLTVRLMQAKQNVLAMESDLRDVTYAHRKEEVDAAQTRLGKHQQSVDKQLGNLEGLSGKGAQEIKDLVAAWKKSSGAVVLAILDGHRLDAEELAQGDVVRQSKAIHAKLDTLISEADVRFGAGLEPLNATVQLEDLAPSGGAMLFIALIGLVGLRLLASGGGAAPKSLDEVVDHLDALADGSQGIEALLVDGDGPVERLKNSTNRIQDRLASVLRTAQSHAEALNAASYALVTTAGQQQSEVSNHADETKKTKATLEGLLESAIEVAEVSQRVFSNAESTQHNAQVVANSVETLAQHSGQLSELAAEIKDLGSRSDLLALNAALEGAKAGVTGRRFSLVAARMERLSEQIVASAKGMEHVAASVASAAQSSSMATEESLNVSKDSAFAARKISLAVQQQREGTQEVVQTMSEMALKSDASVDVSHQVLAASERVGQLAEELNRSLMSLDS